MHGLQHSGISDDFVKKPLMVPALRLLATQPSVIRLPGDVLPETLTRIYIQRLTLLNFCLELYRLVHQLEKHVYRSSKFVMNKCCGAMRFTGHLKVRRNGSL